VAIAEKKDERQLTVLPLEGFYEDEDAPAHGEQHFDIDIKGESYIIVFTGRRGGGKTTCMSFFAAKCMALYDLRVLSNYPIEFMLCRNVKGVDKFYIRKSEPLDLFKLLCFDNDYRNCLICIDEAPDIISHMAAQTWKNRLLNIFVRQLRKNNNSLFLCAQDFQLIDKSLRWQVDIEIQCKDAKKTFGNPGLTRGSVILLRWLDNSGMWTGQTWQEKQMFAKIFHDYDEDNAAADNTILHAQPLWGDDTHKPVFDTYYQQDIWESLKKVDMHLSSYKVGGSDNSEDRFPVSPRVLQRAYEQINGILQNISPEAQPAMYQKDFYRNLGALTEADKNNLGKKLSEFNIQRGGEGSKRFYHFGEFDLEAFKAYVEFQARKVEETS
jgi:hypothetical protein